MKIPNLWTFKSKDVAENFDTHVREQLPWYDLCTDAINHIVLNYLPEGGLIYDIGCSTGNLYFKINDVVKNRNATYIGIDNSKDMLDLFDSDCEKVLCNAFEYDYKNFDVCIMFLTLMFIESSKQNELISILRNRINFGGILIIVDKNENIGGYFGTVLNRLALKEKLKSTSPENIIKKELSLSGIQRPIKKNDILDGIDFFRFGEFFGVVIESKDLTFAPIKENAG